MKTDSVGKEQEFKLIEELIALCIYNWDNEFVHEIQDELVGLRGDLVH